MAQQLINIGSSANKGDGDAIRTAFDKVNDNFTELYLDVVDLKIAVGTDRRWQNNNSKCCQSRRNRTRFISYN